MTNGWDLGECGDRGMKGVDGELVSSRITRYITMTTNPMDIDVTMVTEVNKTVVGDGGDVVISQRVHTE